VSLAQYSDTALHWRSPGCHSRARVWRARGILKAVRGRTKKTGILHAAATRENDRISILQAPHCHYIRQLLIRGLSILSCVPLFVIPTKW
jgi:hypothetical protein